MNRRIVRQGKVEKEARTKKIHISKLQLGMYVSKLDRDWIETPFLMQGFLVESLDDIDILAELCEYVWIDAVFEEWTKPTERGASSAVPSYKVRYINKIPPQQEHRKALGVYKEARKNTKTLLDDVRFGGVLNSELAKETVNECVLSIIRNPDALLWMSKVRSEDDHLSDHSLNVCILAIAFGRHLGFSESELKQLGLCGLLHDLGKIRVDKRIAQARRSLSEKETKILKAHCVYGRNLLLTTPGIYRGVVDVAYSHHEREDGQGYPRGVKGKSIPRYAKMISIIDTYDNMIAHRYEDLRTTSTDALKYIYANRNSIFDDHLALAFIKTIGLYPPGSIVELKNGEVGIVLESNKKLSHLPKIMTVLNKNKQRKNERVLDLSCIEEGKLSKNFLIRAVHKDGEFGLRIQDFKDKGLQLKH